jgi:hypothetical protein
MKPTLLNPSKNKLITLIKAKQTLKNSKKTLINGSNLIKPKSSTSLNLKISIGKKKKKSSKNNLKKNYYCIILKKSPKLSMKPPRLYGLL